MKVLILDTYYPSFVRSHYAAQPDLARRSYLDQRQALMDRCFGTADFYSSNLRRLGHEAEDLVVNCEPLQRQWAQEHGLKIPSALPRVGVGRLRGFPIPNLRGSDSWIWHVLAAQIQESKPDVLYIQDPFFFDAKFLQERARPHAHLIVGQHAVSIPPNRDYSSFDLMISSLPNLVDQFQKSGTSSAYLALGFEARIADSIGKPPKAYQVVHVGGYAATHRERTELLETVARQVEVDFWGYDADRLPIESIVRKRFHGDAWGLDMYNVRAEARIVLSKHISAVAGSHANIMTLFETTGIGSLLLIDNRADLSRFFEVGKEVVAYDSIDDCLEKARFLLSHDAERETIAHAGQKRTLRDHTYYHRMQELLNILKPYI